MELLNIIGLILWLYIAFKCYILFIQLQKIHYTQAKVLVLVILLLAGLNIGRSFISVNLDITQTSSFILLAYFYIGTSVFQLLLSNCVLERIKESIHTQED